MFSYVNGIYDQAAYNVTTLKYSQSAAHSVLPICRLSMSICNLRTQDFAKKISNFFILISKALKLAKAQTSRLLNEIKNKKL
jgi:Sec7-like guanine-nucleotide exchange factor